jgi:hypothetical protein
MLYPLITAVSYVHKTWYDVGHFNNESGRLKFCISETESLIKKIRKLGGVEHKMDDSP